MVVLYFGKCGGLINV